MISVSDAMAFVRFTSEEQHTLEKLEGTIDSGLIKLDGLPARFTFPLATKIAYGLKRRYEQGGWRVGVAWKDDQWTFDFIPTFPHPQTQLMSKEASNVTALVGEKKKLPPLVNRPVVYALSDLRLHICMPTRGRPEQAIEVLTAYRQKAGTAITIEVVVDEDDSTMLAAEVLQRLVALDCIVTVGNHKSKIEAVNGGRFFEWDVLLLASDDMMPTADDYAVRAIAAMKEKFPYLDGAIFFNDGYQGPDICTLPIIGKYLHRSFYNQVYAKEYVSVFSDVEQTEILKAIGRLEYIDEKIIEHRHFACGKALKDELYEKNESFFDADKATYERRKTECQPHSQFGFYRPPLWLSICVCTIPARQEQMARLYRHLQRNNYHDCIEILIDDRTGVTIGEKRQALLERAKGHYISFVDDDDWVSHDYFGKIARALWVGSLPQPGFFDCATLNGVMTTGGAAPETFLHSLEYREWKTENGVHYRSPNHLNPVRRELALATGFVAKNFGEDHDYSTRLLPLLKTEARIEGTIYYYFYNPVK